MIWFKNGNVFIKMDNNFVYDFNVSHLKEMGSPLDAPYVPTVMGMVNRLREKKWWGASLERSFIEICEKMIHDN